MRVLVTGAARGIGRAACLRLARDAAAGGKPSGIAAADLGGSPALDAVVSDVEALGVPAIAVHADMATPDGPAAAAAQTIGAFGGLDGLVSNAGINSPGPFAECAVDDWDRVFAVNVRAAWLLAKAARAALVESGGAMVIVSSMSGGQAHANLGPYGPSKAAAIMLAKVLAQELAPHGVRVNSVSPGMVRTGMTEKVYQNEQVAAERAALVPVGRVALPEDIADVIAFLLGPDARYVNGHDLLADGGLTGNLLGRLPGLANITPG